MFPRLNQKMWDFLSRARQWLQMTWDRLLGRAPSSTLAPNPGTPLTSVCEEEMVTKRNGRARMEPALAGGGGREAALKKKECKKCGDQKVADKDCLACGPKLHRQAQETSQAAAEESLVVHAH